MNQRPHLDPFLLELPGHAIMVHAATGRRRILLTCQCGWRQDDGNAGESLGRLLLLAHVHHEVVRNRSFEFTSQPV